MHFFVAYDIDAVGQFVEGILGLQVYMFQQSSLQVVHRHFATVGFHHSDAVGIQFLEDALDFVGQHLEVLLQQSISRGLG